MSDAAEVEDSIAHIIAPELWGNPFAYPSYVRCNASLKQARDNALNKARRILEIIK